MRRRRSVSGRIRAVLKRARALMCFSLCITRCLAALTHMGKRAPAAARLVAGRARCSAAPIIPPVPQSGPARALSCSEDTPDSPPQAACRNVIRAGAEPAGKLAAHGPADRSGLQRPEAV